MAKRNRPILYEVFGSQTRVKGWGSAPAKKKRPPAKRRARSRKGAGLAKELRVSYELAAVIGLLSVVLGSTLYYFGWVRGKDPGTAASLASQAPSEGTAPPGAGQQAPRTGDRAAPRVDETYYAVRVFTASHGSGATRAQIRQQAASAFKVREFLAAQGHGDARTIRHAKSRSVVVYVGRAENKAALDGLVRRIRRMTMGGKKPFTTAYATRITVRK